MTLAAPIVGVGVLIFLEIAVEKNSTIVFPLPVDTIKLFLSGMKVVQSASEFPLDGRPVATVPE